MAGDESARTNPATDGGSPAGGQADASSPSSVELLGLRFDMIDEAGAVAAIVGGAAAGRGGWACPVNLDVLRQHAGSEEVRGLVAEADLVLADGMPIVWASRLAGTPLPERVAGSTMVHSISAAAAAGGLRVFLLGGAGDTAALAAEYLREEQRGILAIDTYSPPQGFEGDTEQLRVISDRLLAAHPHVVFVGLGFPKQERLIRSLRPDFPATWFVSCGISFSFVSGHIRRAPLWVQRTGMEWLHRLVQEPGRLYRRYLLDGLPFLARLLASAMLSGWRARRQAITPR